MSFVEIHKDVSVHRHIGQLVRIHAVIILIPWAGVISLLKVMMRFKFVRNRIGDEFHKMYTDCTYGKDWYLFVTSILSTGRKISPYLFI